MKNYDWVLLNDSNPLFDKQYAKIVDDEAGRNDVLTVDVYVHIGDEIRTRTCSKLRMNYVPEPMQDFLNALYGYDKEWHNRRRWDDLLNFD